MEKNVKKSGLARIPAWALSLMTLVILIILLVFLEDPKNDGFISTIQIIGYSFCAILIIGACFFICRTHPKSIWYTLIICNAVGILGFISNITLTFILKDYSISLFEMILWAGIFVLSVIAAIVGTRIGQRIIN